MAANSNLRLRLHVPSAISKETLRKKRGRPPGRVAQYDSEIVRYDNLGYLPARIAELLSREHDLDPAIMNRKSVERRLRTIQANSLAKLKPVNEDADLAARDTPKQCKNIFFFFFDLFFFSEGQKNASLLGDLMSQDDDFIEPDGKSEQEEDGTVNADDAAVTLAHFKDAGFLYTEEGEKNWVIFIARNINSTVRLTEIQDGGIILTWTATPPSDTSVIAVQKITLMDAGQMNLQHSSCKLFVPSPRQLSKDSSKIQRGLTPPPPATAEWLVISIPFEDTSEDLGIELVPLKPNG